MKDGIKVELVSPIRTVICLWVYSNMFRLEGIFLADIFMHKIRDSAIDHISIIEVIK